MKVNIGGPLVRTDGGRTADGRRADGRRAGGRTAGGRAVGVLSRDYQIFWDG